MNEKSLAGMRGTLLAGILMLLTEYALGVLTQLYGRAPASDDGLSVFGAFWASVVDGPVLLTLHAIVGTLLIANGVTAVIRAIRLRGGGLIGLTIAAALCMLAAWGAGSSLVAGYGVVSLLIMALGAAAAIGCYAVALFRIPAPVAG
ncbi:hypothetical protein [Humibacter ginsenosidimutans]|uniref:Uncharacterized protein n=1 Tax=Humibacter ginsenosidimutans TaxID=2599293 RepID=A0A5B8M559_9MICO|nr:hypothetical protein [Humibacter ginsenosidimutans]QDZ15888.1 hypothetical protein FPZ11_14895 [Humibacter ginsenosidimutans]